MLTVIKRETLDSRGIKRAHVKLKASFYLISNTIVKVDANSNFYVISESRESDETLIFRSDESGNITDFCEIGAAPSIDYAIKHFAKCVHDWRANKRG